LGLNDCSPPQRLKPEHKFDDFDCQEQSLNDWLKNRAIKNDLADASRTYVVCCGDRVVAYYSTHLGSIEHSEVSAKVKRNMPNPMPAFVLGRLAVDENYQKRGIGKALIKDMFLKALEVSERAGTKVVLVEALHENAMRFYESFGFVRSKTNPLLLMKLIAEVRASFEEAKNS
jgi:GNAT superfamily N-acetyltransferase